MMIRNTTILVLLGGLIATATYAQEPQTNRVLPAAGFLGRPGANKEPTAPDDQDRNPDLALEAEEASLDVGEDAELLGADETVAAVDVDMGTAFTYQGYLEKPAGSPVTNFCDFRFGLWNAPAVGDPKGISPQTNNGVSVSGGVFTTSIDFGAAGIHGTARWLEIEVRCPTLVGGFQLLNPRVELKPAPHALALPGLYTQQNPTSPNLIGGYSGNSVTAGAYSASIGGGGEFLSENKVTDTGGTIAGGSANQAGDGAGTTTTADFATVCGGVYNKATGKISFVAGGQDNTASGPSSTVGGGQDNQAKAWNATIAGGGVNALGFPGNRVYDDHGFVGGGVDNQAGFDDGDTTISTYATVAGGEHNRAAGEWSTVGGGFENKAFANATVPGGYQNEANGSFSFAAGRRAKSNHNGTFGWADSTDADFASTGPNQFRIRASAGMRLATGDGSIPHFQAITPSPVAATDLAINPLGGNVGIGTFGPAARLHSVEGDPSTSAIIGEQYAATDDTAAIYGKHLVTDYYGIGVLGQSRWKGVVGQAISDGTALVGTFYGVKGEATGGSAGTTSIGVHGSASGLGTNYAGYFEGNVHVNGTLSKTVGTFKIDHPLDPENKYLYHSFVESPDVMNIYNGIAVLDADGKAAVELPDYFEALNRDFRYQLTAIGAPGPNLYIAEEVINNSFRIAGGKPGMKVSWTVTGVRQDAYMKAHPMVVEENKKPEDRGKYLHPELFGHTREMGIGSIPQSEKAPLMNEQATRQSPGERKE